MALNPILESQQLTLTMSEGVPMPMAMDVTLTAPLVVGETYTVTWNGTDYVCVAALLEQDVAGLVMLGNAIVTGGEDDGIPFACQFVSSEITGGDEMFIIMSMYDTTDVTYTVAIYQGKAEKDVNYRIMGSTLRAIANAVRGKTGITEPMFPTEFADAINSITGGGGGGSVEWLYAKGSVKNPTTTEVTVNHELGVIPDIIVAYIQGGGTVTGTVSILLNTIVLSKKMFGASNVTNHDKTHLGTACFLKPDTNWFMSMGSTGGIETLQPNNLVGVASVTENTFVLGGTSIVLGSNFTYDWFAFARK